MRPRAIIGEVLSPEPLGRATVVVDGGKVIDVIRTPRSDGVHVHAGALRLAYRQRGPEGLALVTDAVEDAGMSDGGVRAQRQEGSSGRWSGQAPQGTLAGSVLTMDAAVRNTVELSHVPMRLSVRMATQTPAEILGMPGKGSIVPGANADLVVLSADCAVEESIVAGETVCVS